MSSTTVSSPPTVDTSIARATPGVVNILPISGTPTHASTVDYSTPVNSTVRIRNNTQIHQLYLREEFPACLALIEKTIQESAGQAEFAIYIKALIRRQEGDIQDSLALFQAATCINPHNVSNLKQVGRSLFLLGRHKQALEVYGEAQRIGIDDWEVWHQKGLCQLHLKNYPDALTSFQQSLSLNRHDCTYLAIGKVLTLQERYEQAIEVYLEALEQNPENSEILTTIGLLYLRLSQNYKAFDYLQAALNQDGRSTKAILAFGSIVQDHNDMDLALIKYRIAAIHSPNSAQLWNNIGMCLFGKLRFVASIACLKRALYHDPFEWIISYNLGLVHLNTGQFASAFHYLSSSINIKSDFPSSYMYLAICLARLDDIENACAAYDKAIALESDHLFHLNFAITCWTNNKHAKAREQWALFQTLWNGLNEDVKNSDPEVIAQMNHLERAMTQAAKQDAKRVTDAS